MATKRELTDLAHRVDKDLGARWHFDQPVPARPGQRTKSWFGKYGPLAGKVRIRIASDMSKLVIECGPDEAFRFVGRTQWANHPQVLVVRA